MTHGIEVGLTKIYGITQVSKDIFIERKLAIGICAHRFRVGRVYKKNILIEYCFYTFEKCDGIKTLKLMR